MFSFFPVFAQQDTSTTVTDSIKQRDIIDVFHNIIHSKAKDDENDVPKKLAFSVIPSVGYSITTGFNVDLSADVVFFTGTNHQNLSQIGGEITYATKDQKIFVLQSEIWSKTNRFKVVTDIRLEQFPENTYGLGTLTTEQQANHIDYKYLRTYLTIYRKLIPDFYAGAGFNLDYHFNITEEGNADHSVSDFYKYHTGTKSASSGINLAFLYDSRRNPVNPPGGGYASIIYRNNNKVLWSDNNWQSLQIDLRRYIKLSAASRNVLAVWVLVWLTQGHTPYLDLPGTALDMTNNSGRGYVDGRFIGKNMLYAETEYRFGITSNGLLGGVVFANAQSLSELEGNRFRKIAPAAGAGLRIKVNKHSNTNIGIDYAVGIYKSNGLFLNLGEAF